MKPLMLTWLAVVAGLGLGLLVFIPVWRSTESKSAEQESRAPQPARASQQ